jgi:hypothetical protein
MQGSNDSRSNERLKPRARSRTRYYQAAVSAEVHRLVRASERIAQRTRPGGSNSREPSEPFRATGAWLR